MKLLKLTTERWSPAGGTDSPYRSEDWSFVISGCKSEDENAGWLNFVNGHRSTLRQTLSQMFPG
jgi:hypothetical protein